MMYAEINQGVSRPMEQENLLKQHTEDDKVTHPEEDRAHLRKCDMLHLPRDTQHLEVGFSFLLQ